ncbi:MAG: tetratricopeptide repeat protein [Dehalococcoidia bacterium]
MKKGTSQAIRRLHSEGLALSDLGKHKEALAKFEKIVKLDDRDNYAWHRKGIELNSLKKYKEALDCFDRAIVIKRNDEYGWNHRGVALRELGRYDEALRSCNKAIRINNKYPFAWYTKGSILQHLGDLAGAKDCFQNAVRFAPDNDSYRKRLAGINEIAGRSGIENETSAQLHHDGIALSKLGKHEEALAQFKKAIKLDPEDNVAWHRKGIELNALGKYNEAIECFERAIRINSRDKFAWNHRALSLCRLGNYGDAITSCNEAIKIDDTYPFAWCNRAVISAHLEDFEDFQKCFRRARQLDPKGLNNRFLAEHLPKIGYEDLLSRSKGDVKRSSYYCCELCLVHLQIEEMPQALKYALDLGKYANEKVKAVLKPLIEELEFRIDGGIGVTEDLIERADVILHQVKMGW